MASKRISTRMYLITKYILSEVQRKSYPRITVALHALENMDRVLVALPHTLLQSVWVCWGSDPTSSKIETMLK